MESEQRDGSDALKYRNLIEYDVKNRVSRFSEATGNGTHKAEYTYDKDNRVTAVTYNGSNTTRVDYTYDKLNRITSRKTTNSVEYNTQYGYVQGNTAYGTNATTPLVASITQGGGTNAFSLAYTYDSRGNITSETRNNVTTTYEYDALGQLVRVNDPWDGTAFEAGGTDQPSTTWIYRYDRGGNILAKEIYDYTTGTVGAVIRTISFTYGDTNWKDKLTVFDNATYTYDSIGNLTNDGWWTYTWEAGRQLKKLSHGSGDDLAEIEFTYNHAGIRTKKVKKLGGVLQTTTEYILNGDKVVELIYTDHVNNTVDILHFFYDAQGKPAMVKHGSNMYAYVYNLQGDVLGLTDNTGALVADYRYDAWGSQGPEINDDVGYLNPFRYRGYIYDVETGLYYLKSRYYNSMICRFVCADKLVKGNLFGYCSSNPIILFDPNGQDEWGIPGESNGSSGGVPLLFRLNAIQTASSTYSSYTDYSTIADVEPTYPVWAVNQWYEENWIFSPYNMTIDASSFILSEEYKMQRVAKKGLLGEQAAGIKKNTTRIPSLTGTAKYRIPDEYIEGKFLKEVKNYSRILPFSNQLKDELLFAQQENIIMYLQTDAILTSPLQNLINSGAIIQLSIYNVER